MARNPTIEDYALLQKLSNDYETVVEGPLVGERQSSCVLIDQYAEGDPVHQMKAESLVKKFPWFRACRGDGHCGWRAITFGYFEALVITGEKIIYFEEETRLQSLNNLLNNIGVDAHLYEDFAGDTYELLRKLESSTIMEEKVLILMESFNDDMLSASIITYLKFLTSAWMQTHEEKFQPFLLDKDVIQYCKISVEPHLSEIEHVGITAIFDLLLKPIGFGLEVLYLDRSPGNEVNTYELKSIESDESKLLNVPIIRLLYRPGHYDMLYTTAHIVETPPKR